MSIGLLGKKLGMTRVYDDKGLFQMADMDLAHHDRILRLLYAAVLDSRKWVEVLHEMRALFAANFLTLILREGTADDSGLLIWVGNIAGEDVVRFAPSSQVATPVTNLLADHVYTIADLMEVSAWRGSSYFQHWCVPHDIFHVMLVDISTAGAGVLRTNVFLAAMASRSSRARPGSSWNRTVSAMSMTPSPCLR